VATVVEYPLISDHGVPPDQTLPEANTCLVACLCAAWCRACEEYRDTFADLARENHASARFVWVDIEEDEDVLSIVDIVAFPTLLIALGEKVVFFGAVAPRPQIVRQLLQRALAGQLDARHEPELARLAAHMARVG
jgi:thioredoxin-like negative regulator of GroEL